SAGRGDRWATRSVRPWPPSHPPPTGPEREGPFLYWPKPSGGARVGARRRRNARHRCQGGSRVEPPTDGGVTGRHPSSMGGRRAGRPRWLLLGGLATTIALLASLFAFGLSRDPSIVVPVIVGRP